MKISDTFELGNQNLIEKGGIGYPDFVYALCKKTESEYVFSNDCKINSEQYVQDWIYQNDHTYPNSKFFKKYGASINSFGWLGVVHVDRNNLQTEMVTYNLHLSESEERSYMWTDQTKFSCSISKPKI